MTRSRAKFLAAAEARALMASGVGKDAHGKEKKEKVRSRSILAF